MKALNILLIYISLIASSFIAGHFIQKGLTGLLGEVSAKDVAQGLQILVLIPALIIKSEINSKSEK
jgi:hypothetical protein